MVGINLHVVLLIPILTVMTVANLLEVVAYPMVGQEKRRNLYHLLHKKEYLQEMLQKEKYITDKPKESIDL